jgi:hypothetical protein
MELTSDTAAAPSGPSQKKVPLNEILAAAGSAEKFRDLLGIALTITDFEEVTTKNGETIQIIATDDQGAKHVVWAPSVVEKQVRQLEQNEYLPIRLVPGEVTGAAGREYFTLEEPPDA